MKGKKCPYCGRRITYLTVFHEKKHGVYECTRCKKESKVKIDKRLIISFAALVLLIILYIIFWRNSPFYNNILGIIPPIVCLIVFFAMSLISFVLFIFRAHSVRDFFLNSSFFCFPQNAAVAIVARASSARPFKSIEDLFVFEYSDVVDGTDCQFNPWVFTVIVDALHSFAGGVVVRPNCVRVGNRVKQTLKIVVRVLPR